MPAADAEGMGRHVEPETVKQSLMSRATITVVHAPACHFCADARETLADLEREGPTGIEVEFVEADSDAGRALIDTHRPAMFPLVLIDGIMFSQGRLPRRKLQAFLRSQTAAKAR
jgi:glutaredoxin